MTAGGALDNNIQLVFELINSSESTLFDKKKACGFVEKLLALQGQINHESVSIFIRLLDEFRQINYIFYKAYKKFSIPQFQDSK